MIRRRLPNGTLGPWEPTPKELEKRQRKQQARQRLGEKRGKSTTLASLKEEVDAIKEFLGLS